MLSQQRSQQWVEEGPLCEHFLTNFTHLILLLLWDQSLLSSRVQLFLQREAPNHKGLSTPAQRNLIPPQPRNWLPLMSQGPGKNITQATASLTQSPRAQGIKDGVSSLASAAERGGSCFFAAANPDLRLALHTLWPAGLATLK